MRTIRASEVGTFLYCQRAWWYQQRGEPSANTAEMVAGAQIHEQHGRTVIATGCLRVLAYSILLISLALLAYALTYQIF